MADKLDNYKEKGNNYTEEYIKEIQDTYRQEDVEIEKPKINKGKQQIWDEEVLLYKPYKIELLKPKTLEPKFIQDKINDLNKYIKLM